MRHAPARYPTGATTTTDAGPGTGPGVRPPALPDPEQLAHTDACQLSPPQDDDNPPRLPAGERDTPTTSTLLDGSDEPPL